MRELVAVLDYGSNGTRFLLARVTAGAGFRVLHEERHQTRLADGRDRSLPRRAVDEALRATRGFLELLSGRRPARIVAIATAAVREAGQRGRLVDALKREFDVDLRVLSGAAEARLGALAALRTLPLHRGVVLDLGGGSLQLSRVRGARIASVASIPLGAVRATRSFLRHDPPSPEELQELRVELRAAVLGTLPPAWRGGELVGLGGTIGALARMHLAGRPGRRRRRHGLSLALADVSALRERAAGQPLKRRRRVPGLSADRADVIVAGAVIVEELMRFGGYPRITVCGQRVRHGLLWSLAFPGTVRC